MDVLVAAMQAMPLERFKYGGAPTDAIWQLLESRQKLRRLEIALNREPESLARLANMKQLEHLTILCAEAPSPSALQQLRARTPARSEGHCRRVAANEAR